MMKSSIVSAICSGIMLLGACGCVARPEDSPSPATSDFAAGPVRLELQPGQSLQIVLDGNATTGYTWHCSNASPQVATIQEGQYLPSNPGMCGAPGKFTWLVQALAPGEAKLVFRYYRSWEGFDPKQDLEQIYLIKVSQP